MTSVRLRLCMMHRFRLVIPSLASSACTRYACDGTAHKNDLTAYADEACEFSGSATAGDVARGFVEIEQDDRFKLAAESSADDITPRAAHQARGRFLQLSPAAAMHRLSRR